jgi:hypothetical protein
MVQRKIEDTKGVIRSRGAENDRWYNDPKKKDHDLQNLLFEQTGSPLKVEVQWAKPVSLTFHSVLSKPYAEPFMGASSQVSVHFSKRFQRRIFFRNRSIRNKNCLWRPCLLMNRTDISNLNRKLSIDDSY